MDYFVYIITNSGNQVLYTGVTSNLEKRIFEHREGVAEGFTKLYGVHKLVYYESTNDIGSAITREKQIKGLLRKKKIALIEAMNPRWRDLSEDF